MTATLKTIYGTEIQIQIDEGDTFILSRYDWELDSYGHIFTFARGRKYTLQRLILKAPFRTHVRFRNRDNRDYTRRNLLLGGKRAIALPFDTVSNHGS
jgi:hypothetical protein